MQRKQHPNPFNPELSIAPCCLNRQQTHRLLCTCTVSVFLGECIICFSLFFICFKWLCVWKKLKSHPPWMFWTSEYVSDVCSQWGWKAHILIYLSLPVMRFSCSVFNICLHILPCRNNYAISSVCAFVRVCLFVSSWSMGSHGCNIAFSLRIIVLSFSGV